MDKNKRGVDPQGAQKVEITLLRFKYPVIKFTVDETRMWCVQTIGLDGVPGEET